VLERVAEICGRLSRICPCRLRRCGLAGEEDIDGFHESVVEAGFDLLQGSGFDIEYATGRFQAHCKLLIIMTLAQLGRSSACLRRQAAPLRGAGMR